MPDPIDQTTTNPQSLVDAALGSEPVVAPVTPPPLAPLTPPVAEPVVSPEPVPTPTPNVTMGDDTPLAFAMPAPSSTTTTNVTPSTTTTTEQPSSYIPPIAPAPTMAPEEPKKKSKVGLIVGGILLLVVMLGGGTWGYTQYTASTTTKKVAISSSPVPQESAEIPQVARIVEDTGKAIVRQTPAQERRGGGQIQARNDDGEPVGRVVSVTVGALDAADTIVGYLNDHELTAKEIKEKAQEDAEKAADSFNNKSSVGGPCDSVESTAKCAGGTAVCSNGVCGGTGDQCAATDNGCPTSCNSIAGGTTGWYPTKEPGGGSYCDDQGRLCKRYRREMMKYEVAGQAGNSWCFLGYGEQCGQPGSCSPGETVTDNPPTMSCTGLSYVPTTTPVIGSTLTFTCAGAVVPASAGTLSYKFRYSIGSGTVTPLTNKTTTTAELTIAACGSYSVECQACTTLSGVLTCDPTWTGATTP